MINNLSSSQQIVDADGIMSKRMRDWAQAVTRLGPLVGSGSPEGAEESEIGRFYIDSSGMAGAILYVKRDSDIAGDRSQGWVLV